MATKPIKPTNPTKLTRLTRTTADELRLQILNEQQGMCWLCDKDLKSCIETNDFTKLSLDHQHRRKKTDPIGFPSGGGLVRGVLCRECNRLEGKVWNAMHRFGKHQIMEAWLQKYIEYLRKPNYPYIHPSERMPIKPTSKRQYTKLVKAIHADYQTKQKNPPKLPAFVAKRAPSKKLQEWFDKMDISPYPPPKATKSTKTTKNTKPTKRAKPAKPARPMKRRRPRSTGPSKRARSASLIDLS